ncbi:MAG: hypothetical protein R3F11_02340 [Verrucomicrobiales bacterium]
MPKPGAARGGRPEHPAAAAQPRRSLRRCRARRTRPRPALGCRGGARPGLQLAVRREAFEKIGGFREVYHAAGDDVDFCWRLEESGARIAFAPRRWSGTGAAGAGAYLRQQRGYGKAEALLMRDHPGRFGATGGERWRAGRRVAALGGRLADLRRQCSTTPHSRHLCGSRRALAARSRSGFRWCAASALLGIAIAIFLLARRRRRGHARPRCAGGKAVRRGIAAGRLSRSARAACLRPRLLQPILRVPPAGSGRY